MAEIDPEPRLGVNRWPLVVAVGGAFLLCLYFLQPILSPFVLGALIGYLGDPLVDALERRHVNRTLGVVIVFMLFTALLVIIITLAFPLLLHQLDLLVQKVPQLYNWVTQVAAPWLQQKLSVPAAYLPEVDWTGQLADNWQSLGKASARTLATITGSGAGLLLWLANLALVPVVAFYLMRDWDLMMAKALDMLPRAWQKWTATVVGEADEVVGAFLRGQFLVMCALGLLYGAGLWLVGLQLALLLGFARRVFEHDTRARGYTSTWQENRLAPTHHARDATVGIVGVGRIGTSVIRRLQPFGFRLLGFDPYLPRGHDRALGYERCESLDALLAASDFVSLHCPLDEQTRGFIDTRRLALIKPGAVLVNTARGALVDSLDTIEAALRCGRLAAAGLDVLPDEPPRPHPLLDAWRAREAWLDGRLVITPHNAFYSERSWYEARFKAAETARIFLAGGPLRNAVLPVTAR